MHTWGAAEVTELRQWRYHYYSLVVRWGMKLFFTVMSQTQSGVERLVPTCDSAHSLWLYSPATLGHQAAGTMTCYPTQSHYPDTETLSYPNNAKCQARKQQLSILKLLVWLDQDSNPCGPKDFNLQGLDSPIFQHGSCVSAILVLPGTTRQRTRQYWSETHEICTRWQTLLFWRTLGGNKMGRPSESFWSTVGFKPNSKQNNDLEIDTCRFLSWCSV